MRSKPANLCTAQTRRNDWIVSIPLSWNPTANLALELIAAVSFERLILFRGYLALPASYEQDLNESLRKYMCVLQGFTTDERVEQLSTQELMSSAEEAKVWSKAIPPSSSSLPDGTNPALLSAMTCRGSLPPQWASCST